MAKLTREDVLKLAALARINLSDVEVEEFSEELSAILQYVEQLSSVDVAGLAPTNQVTGL
jgi:aspartyl-tRNA(Asn)/glutamyl-tRNA(Gln) amidotransferase subunit C